MRYFLYSILLLLAYVLCAESFLVKPNARSMAVRKEPQKTDRQQHLLPLKRRNYHCRKSQQKESSPSQEDDTIKLSDGKNQRAYPQQTPHSGRHFLPSHPQYQHSGPIKKVLSRLINPFRRSAKRRMNKRFMEGWYYKITLPDDEMDNASFAFIFSVEDPGRNNPPSNFALSAVQVMGPRDEYLVQADRDDTKFWAWEESQGLGCTFEWQNSKITELMSDNCKITAMQPTEWKKKVKTGFQMLPTRLQGRVVGHDGTLGGVHEGQGVPGTCDFDMTIRPLSGWGDDEIGSDDRKRNKKHSQKSTAGWLASFAVFEPHWQVTMADARATGFATWNGKRYDFDDVPFYAEKNWGGEFPSKWYWAQCNAFDGYCNPDGPSRLSVTAGGGRRKIPLGQTEDLGMVSIHYDGKFYEAVPWTGEMEWDVEPWGKWIMRGRCTSGKRLFEAEIAAFCDPQTAPGVVLRAPTRDDGLAYFCRDSFYAEITLSLWELYYDTDQKQYVRGEAIIDQAFSKQGAVEVGGGPWWDSWKGKSKMKQPMKSMVKLPYLAQRFKRKVFRD